MKDLYVVVLVREVTDLEEKSLRRAKWGTEAPNHWNSALRMNGYYGDFGLFSRPTSV